MCAFLCSCPHKLHACIQVALFFLHADQNKMEGAAAEKVPGGQGSHAMRPSAWLKVPAGHALHAVLPSSDENVPAGQLSHKVELVAFTMAENLPTEQGRHMVAASCKLE